MTSLLRNRSFDLSRRRTEILRGVSIVMIMLHNFFHFFPGVINEGEFTFESGLTRRFFSLLAEGNATLPYDVVSFLGWYGVPVFVFLSGYGLVKRYEGGAPFSAGSFLRRNWLKLFFLMLPGVIFFLAEELCHCFATGTAPTTDTIIGILLPLTSLNDLVQFRWDTIPGVYWYFGLAFELYLIYATVQKSRKPWLLWALTALSFIAVGLAARLGSPLLVSYLRHNFTGWLLPFALGVWFGRTRRLSPVVLAATAIISALLFLPSLRSITGWQLSGVLAVAVIAAVAVVFSKLPVWSDFWAWTGRLSAYIFVAHPIVRHLLGRYVFDIFTPGATPTLLMDATYIAATFAVALLYRWLHSLITRR